MKHNLLMLHGGGPTAVLNASLYGALRVAADSSQVEKIYGARGGTGGLLREQLIDLRAVPQDMIERLPVTPGSAIGTSRSQLTPHDYEAMAHLLQKYDIQWVLCTGGNGTMDMCGRLMRACQTIGTDVCVMGVPKTMDNDLAETDHSPGYASAARYMAQSVREVCVDVESLPIHVVIVEALGRNAGWVSAAAALAGDANGFGPDLIYVPERVFDTETFLQDVAEMLKRKQGVVAVVSEGLHGASGQPIVPPLMRTGRATYFGDVSAHLASLVIEKLGYKARSEKPGLLARASVALQSRVDREEAQLVGEEACRAVLAGETGKMVALRRVPGQTYQIQTELVPIERVMLSERVMPPEFINAQGNGVTQAFIDWCRPLLGDPLSDMARF